MRPSVRLAAAALSASVLLTGCGSASEPSPPSGVDELVIPSPSLDPADFVERVDNPWLPLAVGSEWRYAGTGAGAPRTVTVSVLEETREIEGVTATAVSTTTVVGDRRGTATTVDWYAQDDEGNVWHLGQDGVWEAGVDGAQAGLAMPARPRVGDGYRKEYAEGVAEGVAEVTSLAGSASVPYGDLTGLLETQDSTPLEPVGDEVRSYARGIGLVRVAYDEGDELLELVAFDKG